MSFMMNVNRVSEVFFLGIGTIYLLAFLCWRNNFYPFEAEMFLRLADLPLAFFAILFGLTSLRISLSSKYREGIATPHHGMNLMDFLVLFFAFATFALLVYVDIKLPNNFPFPKF